MTDTSSHHTIVAYHIKWKNKDRPNMFHQLCEWYPIAFLMVDPKPLAVSTRDTLEARTDDILQGEDGRELLYKTVRTYINSEAYLKAVMQGGNRINLAGEIEGEVTDLMKAHARSRWKTIYAPKKEIAPTPPQPKRVKKSKPPEKLQPKPKAAQGTTPVKVIKKKRRAVVTPRVRGIITNYVEDRAFGFLTLLNGGDAIFFHKNSFNPLLLDTKHLVGRIVTFQAMPGNQGRGSLSAINLEFEEA